MNSLVKMAAGRAGKYLKLEMLHPEVKVRCTRSGLGSEMYNVMPTYAAGDKASDVVDAELKAGQRVTWQLGTLRATKYHALVEVNPELLRWGYVQLPRIVEPEEETSLVVRLTADKACDVRELPWVVRIYLLD